jgi:hypothetical protein
MPRIALPCLLLAFAVAAPALAKEPFESVESGSLPAAAATPAVETSPTPQTRLYVKTLPQGAQVTLDGQPLGPSDGLFIVPAGTGKVSVQFDGAAPQVQQVEIADGRITRVEFTRTPVAPAAAGGAGGGAGFEPSDGPIRLRSAKPAIDAKPLSKLDATLLAPVPRLTFQEATLEDAIAKLGAAAKVEILIDRRALEDAGIGLAAPVTADLEPLPLESALDAVLAPLYLAAIVRDDLLEVTTQERAAERLFVHVYDVSDLTADDSPAVMRLEQKLQPQSWEGFGGPGSSRLDDTFVRKALVVSQAWPQHWQIARFLAVLRRLKAMPAGQRRPLAGEGYWSDAAAAVAARAALDKPVDAAFREAPLREALAELSKQAGTPIGLDVKSLVDSGLDIDSPVTVTLTLAGQPLAVVLDRILDPLDLTFELTGDRLFVTTKEAAVARLSTAIYPLPLDSRDHVALCDTIQNTVGGPENWVYAGGDGSITAIEGDMRCLVVRQTTAVHRAIDALLRSLE